MNLTINRFRPLNTAPTARAFKAAQANTTEAPTVDQPRESFVSSVGNFLKRASGRVAPYVLAAAGIAAGVAVAAASGAIPIAAGALAVGAVGATLGVAAAAFKGGMNLGGNSEAALTTSVGAAMGAGLGAAACAVGGAPLAGLLVGGVVGLAGYCVGGVLRDATNPLPA